MLVKLIRAVAIPLLLLLFAAAGKAVEVPDLYVVEKPVQSQQAAERRRLTRQGLGEVIVRVSGQASVLSSQRVRDVLQRADEYLQQFSYETRQYPDQDGKEIEQSFVRLQFDQTLVDRLLRDASLPIWGTNRPSLLLWMTLDDGSSRHVIAADQQALVKDAIETQAARRGLPLLFPLMDLQDEANLEIIEAWGLFEDKIEAASQRYQAEAVLAGRVYQKEDGIWAGRWLFMFQGQAYGFNAEAEAIEDYPVQALDTVADFLGRYYGVSGSRDNNLVRFRVSGIRNLEDYAEVARYLEKLAAVRKVFVREVHGDRLVMDLTTEGELRKLENAIALDDRLVPDSEVSEPIDPVALNYRWQPR